MTTPMMAKTRARRQSIWKARRSDADRLFNGGPTDPSFAGRGPLLEFAKQSVVNVLGIDNLHVWPICWQADPQRGIRFTSQGFLGGELQFVGQPPETVLPGPIATRDGSDSGGPRSAAPARQNLSLLVDLVPWHSQHFTYGSACGAVLFGDRSG